MKYAYVAIGAALAIVLVANLPANVQKIITGD